MELTPEEAQRLAGALLAGHEDGAEAAGKEHRRAEVGGTGTGEAGRQFGRYRVTRLIGVGGMGEVYEAEQESPHRRVAIKTVRADLVSPELARRFDLEARVLGRLQHPGIAQIFEAGRSETAAGMTPYFAMEYVEGRPLTEFAREKRLPVRERLELFLKVCEAVEHAHQRGVIHRDLKPGNILIDAAGRARVLDFGVARATDADVRATTVHTEVGKLVGTLPYMSPEQVAGDAEELDTRSDVYSLGVVLYELLAGKLPYEVGRGPVAAAARVIAETEPAALSSVDRVFRGDLDTIVGKALTKEKERRYQSVSALAGDLRRFLADEPIEARPASAMYQMRKFARRNRGVVAGVAAVMVVLLCATLVSSAFAMSERHARREIERLQKIAEERRVRSERQNALANASLSFLESIFIGATPQETKGEKLSADDLVDRAVQTALTRTYEDEELKAAVVFAIGKMYARLGRNEEAMRHLGNAFEVRRLAHGDDDAQSLEVRSEMAIVEEQMGRYDQAIAAMESVLAARKRVLGPADPATLQSEGNLGTVLLSLHRLDEAAPHLEAFYSGQDPQHIGDSVEGLRALHNLAGLRIEQGNFPRAEELAAQAYEGRRRLCGELDPDTLGSLAMLAMIRMQKGELEEAETGVKRLVADYRTVYGERHPQTINQMWNLAGILYQRGRGDDAEKLCQQVLGLRREALGDSHRDTQAVRVLLSRIAQDRKDFAGAEMILREAIASAPGNSSDRELLPMLQRMLGELLSDVGRYEEAEPLLLESFSAVKQWAKPTSVRMRQAVGALSHLYEQWGKPEKAAEYRALLPGPGAQKAQIPAGGPDTPPAHEP